MAGFCKVIMLGVVASDIEYKEFENGSKICKFGLMSTRDFTLPEGKSMTEVAYVVCDVYGDEATMCKERLSRGMPVMIDGRLRYEVITGEDDSRKEYLWLISDRVNFIQSGEVKSEEPKVTE